MSDVLLDIKNLNIVYSTEDGVVRALNDANLQLRRGEALGLVGETGAGKTTLARGIMRLIPQPPGEITSGEIFYEGEPVRKGNASYARTPDLYDFPGPYDLPESGNACWRSDPGSHPEPPPRIV